MELIASKNLPKYCQAVNGALQHADIKVRTYIISGSDVQTESDITFQRRDVFRSFYSLESNATPSKISLIINGIAS